MSPAEWENLLLSKLFHRRHHTHETASDNVEVVAKVSVDQMRVVFRRNISGIHQRIGEIILNKGENHEINTISWISTAVIRSESLEQNVEELSKKLEAHEDAVEKLKNQLNELQQAKISDETALLDKFCEVLNYKKAKIRDQQNLLATAKVDKARGKPLTSGGLVISADKHPSCPDTGSTRFEGTPHAFALSQPQAKVLSH